MPMLKLHLLHMSTSSRRRAQQKKKYYYATAPKAGAVETKNTPASSKTTKKHSPTPKITSESSTLNTKIITDKPDSSPSTEEVVSSIFRQQRLRRRRNLKITLVIALLLIVVSFAGLKINAYRANEALKNNIPAQIREKAKFPLYLPAGSEYKVEKDSFNYSSGVVRFYVTVQDKKFIITEQSKPSGFKVDNFAAGQGISSQRTITTSYGKAIVGKVINFDTGIIAADNTIVTIVSQSPGSSSNIESLISGLVLVKP